MPSDPIVKVITATGAYVELQKDGSVFFSPDFVADDHVKGVVADLLRRTGMMSMAIKQLFTAVAPSSGLTPDAAKVIPDTIDLLATPN